MALNQLNINDPTSSSPISLGDDEFRDLKTELLDWSDQEHHREGPHKFSMGTTAQRPLTGYAGRIYFNTDNLELERDTGVNWVTLGWFSTKRLTSGLYVGNGISPRTLTIGDVAIDFTPTIVVAMSLNLVNGFIYLRMNGQVGTFSLNVATGGAESDNGIRALFANGFTVGANLNANGVLYGFMAFKPNY